jgi:hypothetical protein
LLTIRYSAVGANELQVENWKAEKKEKGKRGSREKESTRQQGKGRNLLTGNLFARKIMVEWRSQKRDKVVPGAKQQVLVLTYAGAT